MVELIALGLLIAFCTWALHREKKFGRHEEKLDNAEAHIDAVDTMKKKAAKDAEIFDNITADALLERVRRRK